MYTADYLKQNLTSNDQQYFFICNYREGIDREIPLLISDSTSHFVYVTSIHGAFIFWATVVFYTLTSTVENPLTLAVKLLLQWWWNRFCISVRRFFVQLEVCSFLLKLSGYYLYVHHCTISNYKNVTTPEQMTPRAFVS